MEAQAVREILREVSKRCPGGRLPDNYVVMDSETSGANPKRDWALQWGLCLTTNREPVFNFAQLVKRSKDVYIHPKALEVHGLTHEKLASGSDPKEVMRAFVDYFTKWRKQKYMFAGHNFLRFDAAIFEREAVEAGCPFTFGDNEIIDTGMIVKAAQIGMVFKPNDTLRSWYTRVAARRAAGVYWSLDRHCIKAYQLNRFLSQDVLDRAHDAGVDCLLTHYLFQVIRDTAYGGKYALGVTA